MKTPRVSVLIPVYNGSGFIGKSVTSMLGQTFSDFELIVIDDHSIDNTVEIVEEFSDPRIRLITKSTNKGLTDSLNLGLTLVKGEYIARMDADDISVPDRLEKQVAFLDQHPEYVCCGCNYTEIPSGKKSQLPLSDEEIKIGLFTNSQFAHPTVMFRRNIIEKHQLNYDPDWEPAEDYKLWVDMSPYGKFANLPEPLLLYRVHQNQISQAGKQRQREKARLVSLHYTNTMSNNHADAAVFAEGNLADGAAFKKYSRVEKIIQEQLVKQGFKNSPKYLLERKQNLLKQAALAGTPRFVNAIKLFVSSGIFLGVKFYISLFLNRRKNPVSA